MVRVHGEQARLVKKRFVVMKLKEIFYVTKQQCKDFGLVAVVTITGISLFKRHDLFLPTAFTIGVITLLIPYLFYPAASLWFALSHLLQRVMSLIIMTVLFSLVVTPVGWLRRWLGHDTLQLKQFKKSTQSVMTARNRVCHVNDFKYTS